ncbi:class I adenylate-forming enzyme family protein [Streptomyces gamaensis]|uniref:Class I adenylate-forming enzyme family protein n=1 Tax=Streptomyces gamaensis TaxID=1763542 RepID=A0ABW0YXW7_9ACTN
MLSGAIRARLADDDALGAGTFFAAVRDVRPGTEQVLWTDGDFPAPDGERDTVLTLDRLAELVETYAGFYHARGVRPRDPVAVCTGSALGYVLNFLALSTLGAVPALVNADLPAAVARNYAQRIGAVGVFADPAHLAALRGEDSAEPVFFATASDVRPEDRGRLPSGYPYRHHGNDPVLITHSSGTTGVPKAVTASHRSFFAATRYRLSLPLPQGFERVLSALPGSHNSAITVVMQSLLSGLPVRILSDRGGDAVLAAVAEFRPTMVAAFAGTHAELASRDLGRADLSTVTLWYNSGDAAHRAHIRALTAHGRHTEVSSEGRATVPGSYFHDGLGSSEMGHSLFYNIHKPGAEKPLRCIGKPYGFVEAAVLSDEGEPLPAGRIGRLGVKSPSITPGYWNDSLTTHRSWLGGYWLTGDLVYRDETGVFYHVDRVTDTVLTRQGRLYSVWAEELLLDACPELEDCTVFGMENSDGSADAWLLLKVRPGAGAGVDWESRVNALLAAQDMPPVARVLTQGTQRIPLGPTGKVKKRQLRALYQDLSRRGEVA